MVSDVIWIERFAGESSSPSASGPSVAVKDLIDVAGSVTTAGCRAVADRDEVALVDAPCIEALRSSGARLVGKTNLHELAFGISGVNPWFGTPPNPSDPGRVPGGSSSGSAVAVALGSADIGLGSDTGGSIRIPAACCGVVGLKPTFGRISTEGVWPLAPSFDTIGPLAADVAGVVAGMRLLEPGFEAADGSESLGVGRVLIGAEVGIDPAIDDAVDEALRRAGLAVTSAPVDGWNQAWRDQQLLLSVEALAGNRELLEQTGGAGIGADVVRRLRESSYSAPAIEAARTRASEWSRAFVHLLDRHGVLALPTVPSRPAEIGQPVTGFNVLTAPLNLTGLPVISIPVPVPVRGRPPTGLQLVAAAGREDLLLGLAGLVERAVS